MQLKQIAGAAVVLALGAAAPAAGTIVVTQPVASTVGTGGQKLDIEWNDNGQAPKLSSDWGGINVFLATGSQNVQYKLAQLGTALPVTRSKLRATIPASAGPDATKEYFLRFEGTKLGSNGIPPMAFSARFTLKGMSGSFNSTITQTNVGAKDPTSGSSGSSTGTGAAAGAAGSSSGMSTVVVSSPSPAAAAAASSKTSPTTNLSTGKNSSAVAFPAFEPLAAAAAGAVALAGAAWL